MVGDILISNTDETESVQLPTNTININNYVKFSHGAPVYFRQKIYVIRPNLCVALGGYVYHMKNFLQSLVSFSNRHPDWIADKKFIAEFLAEFNCDENYVGSAFMMLLLENITSEVWEVFQLSTPKKEWVEVSSEIFQYAIAWGSGTEKFLQKISEKAKFESSHERGDPNQAIQANLGLFARLLAEERVALSTAVQCWGAGFETILFNGKSLFKFPEITYIIFVGHYSKDGKLHNVNPNLVMHYKYYDDVLFIRSIEIKPGKITSDNVFLKFTSTDLEVSKFDVPRLDVPLEVSSYKRPTDLSFKTNLIVIGYSFVTPHDTCCPCYFNLTSAIEVNYEEPKNLIEIKLLPEIHNRMIEEGEAYFHSMVF